MNFFNNIKYLINSFKNSRPIDLGSIKELQKLGVIAGPGGIRLADPQKAIDANRPAMIECLRRAKSQQMSREIERMNIKPISDEQLAYYDDHHDGRDLDGFVDMSIEDYLKLRERLRQAENALKKLQKSQLD